MAPGTRDALIEVAARLLDAGGVEAVTLREVGRQAGVSHNAPSKEALLAAIAARELARQGETLAATVARERSPEAVLRAAMHRYVAWALDYPARFKLTFGNWSIDSEELAAAAHAAQTMLVDLVAATPSAWRRCCARSPTEPPTWLPRGIWQPTARATRVPTTSSTTCSTTCAARQRDGVTRTAPRPRPPHDLSA